LHSDETATESTPAEIPSALIPTLVHAQAPRSESRLFQ
jgi:hypothetical protein